MATLAAPSAACSERQARSRWPVRSRKGSAIEWGMDLGAEDNGPPGPRVSDANFYSAFIIDLDGNNIEATVQES